MSVRNRSWIVGSSAPADYAATLRCLPVTANVLWNRGLRTIDAVDSLLNAAYPEGIHNPLHLEGVQEAVQCICEAIEAGTPITVYGDFDTDGVTSSAVMYDALRAFGATVHVYIPDRKDGYGVHAVVVNHMVAWGSSLLVTVDCGIRNVDEVADIVAAGISVIVTDHHLPPEVLPGCLCIDPKLGTYPYSMLAGVGVAFKLISALARHYPGRIRARDLLDLVALGTVADMAPLTGENRVLVTAGLEALRQSPRVGIQALCLAARCEQSTIRAVDISMVLAPRLNAAGRLAHADLAFRLLTTHDPMEAASLATELNRLNERRQDLTSRYVKETCDALERDGKTRRAVLVAQVDDACEAGIVGLIAGQLVERYNRPAIVLRTHGERAVGSARSLPQLHILDALDSMAELFHHYGGHAAAAGLSLNAEHIPELERRMGAYASVMTYKGTLHADSHASLSDITWGLIEELALLEPYGQEHPRPALLVEATVVSSLTMGRDKQHLKLTVRDGSEVFTAVWWKMGYVDLRGRVQLIVTPTVNEFRGKREIQLEVHDANCITS